MPLVGCDANLLRPSASEPVRDRDACSEGAGRIDHGSPDRDQSAIAVPACSRVAGKCLDFGQIMSDSMAHCGQLAGVAQPMHCCPGSDQQQGKQQTDMASTPSRRGNTRGISRRSLSRHEPVSRPAAGAITGFPTIWAQNIKNITLRQFGTGVSNLNAVADKVKADLGFTLSMTALDTDAVTQKAVTQPKSYDIADIEYFAIKKVSSRPASCSRWMRRRSSSTTRSCRSSPRES